MGGSKSWDFLGLMVAGVSDMKLLSLIVTWGSEPTIVSSSLYTGGTEGSSMGHPLME